MYLWKQWRESRILSALGLIGLLLLAALVAKGVVEMHVSVGFNGFSAFVIGIFYLQAVLIGCWAWLLGSMGVGKNLGEESGSFLFTRPRTRSWFLWHDWAFGMGLLAVVITVSGILFSILLHSSSAYTHMPASDMRFSQTGQSIHLIPLMLLIGFGVLLCTGLVYSLTYFSTIVVKRISGVILGAGIFTAYMVLRAMLHHYYPSVLLPSPVPAIFTGGNRQPLGISDHIALGLTLRTLLVIAFPVAAQLVLNRAEI